MATLLARLADAASRRRRVVIGVWLALLVAGGWFSLHQSDRLSGGGWEVPGNPSVRVSDALDSFPSFSSPALSVLVTGRSPAARRALARATREPRTRLIGQPAIWSNFQEVAKRQLARGETTGFPLILIILLAGFGTLVAALAPLAVGFAAVFLTGAVVYWLSRATEMSIYVTNMASMIGIGVAVDYSLFVVSRYRRELRAGVPSDEALRRALASSGTAVVFSGATVAVSLAGLFVIDVNAVRSMAIGAIVVVTLSVLVSVTLLPALLSL